MSTLTMAVADRTMVMSLQALAIVEARRLRERGTFAGLLEELAAVETAPWQRVVDSPAFGEARRRP